MRTSNSTTVGRLATSLLLALGLSVAALHAQAAATIVIQNNDGAGEGFNDPTPVAPVGGNTGTTLGQQRLNAFQHAANIWGATLTSSQTITVRAEFNPLTCTATTATLGSAGARFIVRDFVGAGQAGTWYGEALANKLAGADLIPGEPEIAARFNSNLGQAGCLTGVFFYLGLDNNHGPNIDLVAVLLHEFGHGLGFQTFTSGSTGAQFSGLPSIWDHFLYDTTAAKLWKDMTDAERATSALNSRRLVWNGANVNGSVPSVLSLGTPALNISGPASGTAAGVYSVGAASFGPPLSATAVAGQLMPISSPATGSACAALSGNDVLAARNNIALIDRGVCGFAVKVKNAQNAGAIGVVIADNVAGSPPPGLGGTDPTITIPAIRISLADATLLRSKLTTRSRTASGVVASLGVNAFQYAGADAFNRMLMFTPNPFQSGSSVSHWDTIAFRNQLMEPAINGDLTHSVLPPEDLTFRLLQDIGW